jgi:hypothetical protein
VKTKYFGWLQRATNPSIIILKRNFLIYPQIREKSNLQKIPAPELSI